MDFNVVFVAPEEKPLVDKLGAPGTDILDVIREENPELKDKPAEHIYVDVSCPINGSRKAICITEETARRTGLFKGNIYREVHVPENFLSQFVSFETKIRTEPILVKDSIYIFGVKLRGRVVENEFYRSESAYTFSAQKIIDAWEAAGFPLRWGFKEGEE